MYLKHHPLLRANRRRILTASVGRTAVRPLLQEEADHG
jgi:hypothetical protein